MKIKAAILARRYEWQDKPDYSINCYSSDPEGERKYWAAHEAIYICDVEIEFEELSPGVFRARQLEGLRAKKEVLRDEFTKQSAIVSEKIENLLAISDQSHEG